MAGDDKNRDKGKLGGPDYAEIKVRFKQAVVRQAAHYVGLVLPSVEDDEGERDCVRAVLDWCEQPSPERMKEVDRAGELIGANIVEHIDMVKAACHAVWAAQAPTVEGAVEQAIDAVGDAAGRHTARGWGDYMGGAIGRRAGRAMAVEWQAEAMKALLLGAELPPFAPLPELPDDREEIVRMFKELYSEEEAYRAGDLMVLLDFMSLEQQARFKRDVVMRQGQQIEQSGATHTEKVEEDRVKYVVDKTVQAKAALEVSRAKQWQAAAAAAIVRGVEMPSLEQSTELATGALGAYLESRLEELVQSMSGEQQLQFKQMAVRQAIELARKVLPGEENDRGHRHCIEMATRWLAEPTEENRKAAWAAAWTDSGGVPSYPYSKVDVSAAWLTARGAAEVAGEDTAFKAAMKLNGVALTAAIVLKGVGASDKEAQEAVERMKSRLIEDAWTLLPGREREAAGDGSVEVGSFWALLEGMSKEQRVALGEALARQARWYAEYAPLPAPTVVAWRDRPENWDLPDSFMASLAADMKKELENQVGYALRSIEEARTEGAVAPLLALNSAADHIAKAAAEAGKRKARAWLVEAARDVLGDGSR